MQSTQQALLGEFPFPSLRVPRLEPGRKWNEDREAVDTELDVTGPTVSLGTRSLCQRRARQPPSAVCPASSQQLIGPRCPPVRKGFPGMSKWRCFCHKVILGGLKRMQIFALDTNEGKNKAGADSSKHMQLCNQTVNKTRKSPNKKNTSTVNSPLTLAPNALSISPLQPSPPGQGLPPLRCRFSGAWDSRRNQICQN